MTKFEMAEQVADSVLWDWTFIGRKRLTLAEARKALIKTWLSGYGTGVVDEQWPRLNKTFTMSTPASG